MKKQSLLYIGLIIFMIFCSCSSTNTAKNESVEKENQNENTKKTGWNDDDVAQYASFFHSLCRKAGYTAFWWDCNDLVDRKNLSCRKKIIDAIMACYPAEEYTYKKESKTFVEEDAASAVHNMKT
ncbi:MAG: hypothetical protein K5829_11500, partial [Treponema sp.]|nr:hypothetical protein [Treponema sp.]